MAKDKIVIKGARVHNLKNIDLELPRDKFIGQRLALDKADCICGTCRQAIAQTVAIIVTQKLGFITNYANRALMAGLGADAAAVTFIFIDMNNSSKHFKTS